jgi:hypothetical protein
MITLVLDLLRLLPFLCGGHRQIALENLALRHQLTVYKRTITRPRLRRTDRLVWVYGESSVFHVFLEPPDATTRVARREDYTWLDAATLKGMAPHLVQALQAGFRVRGVELCVGNIG